MLVAGGRHTVLLRSDGVAVAFGLDDIGQCRIPALEAGVSYTQVAAGRGYTVLLRSDGAAVAFGLNEKGQCMIPILGGGGADSDVRYIPCAMATPPRRIFQAHFDHQADHVLIRLINMSGEEHCRLVVPATDRLVTVENKCIAASGIPTGMGVMLPSGELLRHVILRDPSANIAKELEPVRKKRRAGFQPSPRAGPSRSDSKRNGLPAKT